jgi:hypothetical protein
MSNTFQSGISLNTKEIQSLQPGILVELDGKIGMFLRKDSDSSAIASYSFLMFDGRIKNFKGTRMLVYKNLRKVI